MNSVPLLAQLDKIPANFFVLWCMAALVTLGVVVAVVTVWSNLRQRPPHETPTRREFDDLKGKVGHIEASLPPMERRILEAVEKAGTKVETKIDAVAKSDHEGRVEIWETLHSENKALAERVTRLEARQKS